MKKRIFFLALVLLIAIGWWQIKQFQQPFQQKDIPLWQIQELENGVWELTSVEEPHRKTHAWLELNPKGLQCDTLVIMGGLEEGHNLAIGGAHIPNRANIVAIRHPINQFFQAQPWQEWGFFTWLQLPSHLKDEMRHTIGALQALANYVHGGHRPDPRFTNRVLLSGGSFGGPFPVIVTQLQPEQVAALLVIYGFTNYELVITRELTRQGMIHFKLASQDSHNTGIVYEMQALGVKALARILGFLLGNMLKYGYMELYLPHIYDTPIYYINGRQDHLVPSEAYDPMWDSTPDPKYQVWVEGDHIRPGEPEEVTMLVDQLHKWARTLDLWTCQQ